MGLSIDESGRRILITGAGQGVGRGIAEAFAAAGASVAVNDVDAERAQRVVDGIDVLVNNAGNAGTESMTGRGPFAESDPADWDRYLAVNLYGVMNCARAAL